MAASTIFAGNKCVRRSFVNSMFENRTFSNDVWAKFSIPSVWAALSYLCYLCMSHVYIPPSHPWSGDGPRKGLRPNSCEIKCFCQNNSQHVFTFLGKFGQTFLIRFSDSKHIDRMTGAQHIFENMEEVRLCGRFDYLSCPGGQCCQSLSPICVRATVHFQRQVEPVLGHSLPQYLRRECGIFLQTV